MCGIAGILAPGGEPAPALLEPMLAAQRHRGPDGEGRRVSGPLALGVVRLAVLDKRALAHQPMASLDGRFLLAYNGEVYNHRDLKEELEREGETFRSHGDTEVVLKALSRWGEEAVERMNGVFALAFWDARERRLLLARDRVGVRPLYWTETAGGAILFASEIKGLLASGLIRPGIDGAALAEIFRFQNIWSERTLFSGILPVPPGTRLSFQGGKVERRTWWRFSFPGDLGITAGEAAEELPRRLGTAVRRQAISEVPVGAALSGGLDGAAVALEASRWIPRLPTFTIGFEGACVPGDRAVDERPAARSVAQALGAAFHEEVLSPEEALQDLRTLLWHLEEPRLAASFQNLAAARLARRCATVVLSGGGGDELFAGYPWRYAEGPAAWTRILAGDAFWTREGLGLVSEGDPEGVLRSLEAGAEGSPLHRMMAVEARTFLPAYCVLEDKLHMAFGAEVRVPFLDHDLVDWAVRLPGSLRLSADGRTGKVLLRRALSGRLPASAVEGAKQGFVPPLLSWASRPSWSAFLAETLLGRDRGLIRPDALGKDLETLRTGNPGPLQRVWTSLAFELWCRLFLDGGKPDAFRR